MNLSFSRDEGSYASITGAYELLLKYAPHMLQNWEELQILEKEIADLKKKVKKVKDENDKLRKVVRRKSRQ